MRTQWIPVLLAALLPAFAAPKSSNEWERLNQLTKSQIVRVQLRDGRTLTGYIQEVRTDGLTLVGEKSLAIIHTREIVGATRSDGGQARTIEGYVSFETGQSVELKMRDGSARRGTVHKFSATDRRLWLMEATAGTRLERADIVKVMAKRSGVRLRNALIGGTGGALILWGVARSRSDPKCFEVGAHCRGTPPREFGILGALLGGAGGALFPVKGWTTVYQI